MASNDLGIKIIFLDEADQLTPEAQAAMRKNINRYESGAEKSPVKDNPMEISPNRSRTSLDDFS